MHDLDLAQESGDLRPEGDYVLSTNLSTFIQTLRSVGRGVLLLTNQS